MSQSGPRGSNAMVPAYPHSSTGDVDEIIPVERADYTDNEDSAYDNIHDRYVDDEQAEPEQPRYKYSSASVARPNNRRKYCCIALMFLLFMGFSIGITFLINYLFFRDDGSSNEQQPYKLPGNHTFVQDKQTIDSACSSTTVKQDAGAQCKEVCEPHFSKCCKAFEKENIINGTTSTSPGMNITSDDETCTLSTETQGCVSYSKCIAADGTDPSPPALFMYCAEPALSRDPQSCTTICNTNKCCYASQIGSTNGTHCLGKQLDVCLDFAPCQNLRKGENLVPPAPTNLDQLCYFDSQDCTTACKNAECCNLSGADNCFKDNIVTCLTYAACAFSNTTSTNVTLPPQFSVLPKLPADLEAACDERQQMDGVTTTAQSCTQYCSAAACCTSTGSDNCFDQDPLGCLAWDQQCQNLRLSS